MEKNYLQMCIMEQGVAKHISFVLMVHNSVITGRRT
jgi:hypothetical protein